MFDQAQTELSVLDAHTHRTAHEYAKDVLRRGILSGELESGTRLVQAELATRLKLSTTPIREALRDLSSEGLVRFDPRRGAIVAEMEPEELREVFELRQILEPRAIRQAVPKVTDELIDRLATIHQQIIDDPYSSSYVDLNRSFHLSIYEAGASVRMVGMIRALEDAAQMYIGAWVRRVPYLRERAIRDHGELLVALRERDIEQATEITLRHLSLSLGVLDLLDEPSRFPGEAEG